MVGFWLWLASVFVLRGWLSLVVGSLGRLLWVCARDACARALARARAHARVRACVRACEGVWCEHVCGCVRVRAFICLWLFRRSLHPTILHRQDGLPNYKLPT